MRKKKKEEEGMMGTQRQGEDELMLLDIEDCDDIDVDLEGIGIEVPAGTERREYEGKVEVERKDEMMWDE